MLTTKRFILLLAAGALALSGCGGADSKTEGDTPPQAEAGFTDKSAADIQQAALEDMKALTTVHIKGGLASGGNQIGLDLKVGDATCEGTVSTQGMTANIRLVDGHTYLQGQGDFWTTSIGGAKGAATQKLIGDRWVDLGTGQTSSFSSLCDLDSLVAGFDDDGENPVAKGEESADINGYPAIAIKSTKDTSDAATGWVATSGDHYLLRMEVTDGASPGKVDFTDFNKAFTVEAPTGDDVVDLQSLTGGS